MCMQTLCEETERRYIFRRGWIYFEVNISSIERRCLNESLRYCWQHNFSIVMTQSSPFGGQNLFKRFYRASVWAKRVVGDDFSLGNWSIGCFTKTYFWWEKNGSTCSASIWGLLWRNPKWGLILISFRGCTSHFRSDLFCIVNFHFEFLNFSRYLVHATV